MISVELKVVCIVSLIFYFIGIIYLLKRKSISLKYTLMWIFSGIFMFVMVIFPNLLEIVANIIGIEVVSNAVFAIMLFFVIMILMALTSIVSKLNEKNKNLAQEIGLMERRIRKLEDQI